MHGRRVCEELRVGGELHVCVGVEQDDGALAPKGARELGARRRDHDARGLELEPHRRLGVRHGAVERAQHVRRGAEVGREPHVRLALPHGVVEERRLGHVRRRALERGDEVVEGDVGVVPRAQREEHGTHRCGVCAVEVREVAKRDVHVVDAKRERLERRRRLVDDE